MPRPKTSLIRRLQFMWWAAGITARKKCSDDEFDAAVFALLLGKERDKRDRFLYHARNRGQDLRASDLGVSFEDVVQIAATMPGFEGSDAEFYSPIFLLGSKEAWNYEVIVRYIDNILAEAGLVRMYGHETFAEVSTLIDGCDVNWIDEPYSHVAEDWYLARVEAIRHEMTSFRWLELVVMLFREAHLAGEFDRAHELMERTRDQVVAIFAKSFGNLPTAMEENRLALKNELFADEFVFEGTRSQIEARRRYVGGLALRPGEIQQRREVRSLRRTQPALARRLYDSYCDEWEGIVCSSDSRRGNLPSRSGMIFDLS